MTSTRDSAANAENAWNADGVGTAGNAGEAGHACRAALARAGRYRLLALGFAYPANDVHAEFRRLLALHRAAPQAAPDPEAPPAGQDTHAGLAALAAVTDADADADLGSEYLRLFDRTVACSPYESEHSEGVKSFTKSRDLADVLGFYAAFGLEIGQGETGPREMGDHIRVELEFLATLALKEAHFVAVGDAEGLEITRDAERAFLRDHLGRWGPVFCERLIASAGAGSFHGALAAATRAMIERELATLAVEPPPLRPAGPEADDLAGEEFVCPKAEAAWKGSSPR